MGIFGNSSKSLAVSYFQTKGLPWGRSHHLRLNFECEIPRAVPKAERSHPFRVNTKKLRPELENPTMNRLLITLTFCIFAVGPSDGRSDPQPKTDQGNKPMRLGNFSVSLAVKDLKVSRELYEKLGFKK